MVDESYTLILVPHGKARFRKFQVPARLIRRAKRAGVALGIIFSALFAHYLYVNVRAYEVRRLRAENHLLASRSLEHQRLTDEMKGKLTALETTVIRLGALAGIEGATPAPVVGAGGVGGATSAEALAPSNNLRASLAEIDQKATALQERSSRLEAFYNDKLLLLASTPSTWPVRGYLSARFGHRLDPFSGQTDFHSGVDISTQAGTPVLAPADGIVIFTGVKGAYGNAVVINHGFGIVTQYGHLDRFAVRPGEKLERGDTIGHVGNTGRSTGPHLHYEIWVHDQAKNPLQYLGDRHRKLG